MIAECAADLRAKVRSVPALAESASFTLGGKSTDPGLIKVPLPAAWLVHKASTPDLPDYTHGPATGFIGMDQQLETFCVTVFLPYTTDDDLLGVQYPLLDAVLLAVHGTHGPAGALQWRNAGRRIALVYPDRIAYELKFTITTVQQS